VTAPAGTPEIPTLLDDRILGDLHEDFAETDDLPHLAELMRKFLDRGAEQLTVVAAAVHGGDADEVRRAAHKLKGSSRTLGAGLLGAVAANIEQAGGNGDLVAAKGALGELEVVFSLSRSALLDMIDAIDGGARAVAHPKTCAGLRALLVDDEPIALAVLRAAVERLGHECTVVTDGEAALVEYERLRPQVVITDHHMPVVGGIELAARIRAGGDWATYIAVVSASGGKSNGAIGRIIDAALSKPLREDELHAVLGLAVLRAT
jgi:CheY-like chemotaxis protein/HPt (histidine-containing phosphotransfer) domain-containing protein